MNVYIHCSEKWPLRGKTHSTFVMLDIWTADRASATYYIFSAHTSDLIGPDALPSLFFLPSSCYRTINSMRQSMAGKENFHFGKFQPLFSVFATISRAVPRGGNSVGTFSSFFLLFLKAGKRCSCSAAAPSSLTERGASTNGEGKKHTSNSSLLRVIWLTFGSEERFGWSRTRERKSMIRGQLDEWHLMLVFFYFHDHVGSIWMVSQIKCL